LIVVCSYVLLFFMWLVFYVIVYKWAESLKLKAESKFLSDLLEIKIWERN
jgi:hypothetical protein